MDGHRVVVLRQGAVVRRIRRCQYLSIIDAARSTFNVERSAAQSELFNRRARYS